MMLNLIVLWVCTKPYKFDCFTFCFITGNNSSKSVDFFEHSFSFAANMSRISCCKSNNDLVTVLCGRGLSCAGQCSALGATLCPSANCTGHTQDCFIFPNVTNTESQDDSGQRKVSTSNLPSWVFSWCPRNCRLVSYYPSCCYHPKCYNRKKRRCRWMQNYVGELIQFLT